MGYSLTRPSVLKVKGFLDSLVGNPPIVEWTVADPPKVSYAIRQGMKAAEYLSTEFPQYSKLSEAYALRVEIPNKVVATRKRLEAQETNIVESPTSRTVITDVGADPVAIVSVCVGMPGWFEVFFPNARDLTDIQMSLIYNWAQSLDQDVFIFQTPDGLTLTKNPEVKELGIQWTPSEESGLQTSQATITQRPNNLES